MPNGVRGAIGIALLSCFAAACSPQPSAPTVSTIAGNGTSGYHDGIAQAASFVMPIAVAIGPDGSIYVADFGANRIRVIRNGAVSTLAGSGDVRPPGNGWWLQGGYRDGPAARARFEQPAGVAVGSDQTVYVADAGNHCIRAIHNSNVRTFAGSASVAGATDGAAAQARFAFPRQLAIDGRGDLFVADYGNGIRRITPAGRVTTLRLPLDATKDVVGVAIGTEGGRSTLFASDHAGLIVSDLATGRSVKYIGPAEGNRRLGAPDALFALGSREVAFTDARDHAIRLFWSNGAEDPSSSIVAGSRIDDATNNGGGFKDGAAAESLFDLPRGIVRAANGDFIIADTGNRRIRRISGVDVRKPLQLAEIAAHSATERMFVAGGSYSFFASLWPGSIPGALERDLGKDVTFSAVRYPEGDQAAMMQTLATLLKASLSRVVWVVTTDDPISQEAINEVVAGIPDYKDRLFIVLLPRGSEASPYEQMATTAFQMPGQDTAAASAARYAAVETIVRSSGLTFVDLYGPMHDYAASPGHVALFGTLDPHLTSEGASFVAATSAGVLSKAWGI